MKSTFSDEALKLLSENGYDPVYGARPLKRALSSSRSKTRWHSKYCLVNWFRVKVIRTEVNEDRIVAVSNDKTSLRGSFFVYKLDGKRLY